MRGPGGTSHLRPRWPRLSRITKRNMNFSMPQICLLYLRRAMKGKFSLVIRCGTPDCDWGFPMPDLGEVSLEACFSDFRKHCVEIHGVNKSNGADCLMH